MERNGWRVGAVILFVLACPAWRAAADVGQNETARELQRAESNVLVKDAVNQEAAGWTAAQIAARLTSVNFAAQQQAERSVLANVRAGDEILFARPLDPSRYGQAIQFYRDALQAAATQDGVQSRATIPHARYRLAAGLRARAKTFKSGNASRLADLNEAQQLLDSILSEYPESPEAPHALVPKGFILLDQVAPPVAAGAYAAARAAADTNFERLRLEYPEYHLWGEDAITGTAHAGLATKADEVVFYLKQRHWAISYDGIKKDMPYAVQATVDDGFVVCGETNSFGGDGAGDFWVIRLDRYGCVVWEKTFPNPNGPDNVTGVISTSDGGFLVVGSGADVGGVGVDVDVWALKLRSDGSVAWQNLYGGPGDQRCSGVSVRSDGGFWLAGTWKTVAGSTNGDLWIVRLDANGGIVEQKKLGGPEFDAGQFVETTPDDGCIISAAYQAGGNTDYWILKLRPTGQIEWQKTIGGPNLDAYPVAQQLPDGGYVVAGSTESFGQGVGDAWIMKLDARGEVVWQNCYGGARRDDVTCVTQPPDGGLVFGGITLSYGVGAADPFIMRLATDGAVEWFRSFGGTATDNSNFGAVQPTADGGFVWIGTTESFATKRGIWVLKLDPDGTCPPLTRTFSPMVTPTTAPAVDCPAVPKNTAGTVTPVAVKALDTACEQERQAP